MEKAVPAIMQYRSVASTDPVAADRFCVKLMGLSDTATETMINTTPSIPMQNLCGGSQMLGLAISK